MSAAARWSLVFLLSSACFGQPQNAGDRQPSAPQTVAARTAQLKRQDGFVPFYWDARRGEVLFELSPAALDRDFLYFTALGSGVGSTEIAADRSSFGASGLCHFVRVGPRVLVMQRNMNFRAEHGSPDLRRSIELSFPTSILASLPIEAEENGTLVVNANPLVVRDAFDLLGQIRRPRPVNGGPGRPPSPAAASWRMDDNRSTLDLEHSRAFPLNTELEAFITFAGEAGEPLNQPDARTITVREHHSLVALPEPGYEIRERDQRVGFFGPAFQDFSQPYDQRLVRGFVERWRLQKKDPNAAVSEPVKPITFYLDPAMPDNIRAAARRGALWWNDAFLQAGFRNALVIQDLPPGADPLDVRYPTIQWTSRSGRGWSVGQSQADPRTGEILHAVVQLDSHRMRTVNNYWQASLPGSQRDTGRDYDGLDLFSAFDAADPQMSEEQAMLNRLALLTCHEMGHVLGLEHNFVASTFDRGSVMDYYAPRIRIRPNGTADLSDAYMQGVGSYDKFVVEWGYSQARPNTTPQQEHERLNAIVQRGIQQGIVWGNYADPRWNSYDDGPDPVAWLKDVMPVRDALLKNYSGNMLRPEEPLADLASRFPLVYMFHQYGLLAAVNVIGSAKIPLALNGDGQQPIIPWPADSQKQALQLLTHALDYQELQIDPKLWSQLAPEPNGRGRDPERFSSSAQYLFSPSDGARAVAEIVAGGLLDPARLERLTVMHQNDNQQLSAQDVVNALVNVAAPPMSPSSSPGALLRGAVATEIGERLMVLAVNDAATPEVQALAWTGVRELARRLPTNQDFVPTLSRLSLELDRFIKDPRANVPKLKPSGAPAGPPV